METGLYIHIPFCKSKCRYCDFLSFAQKEALFAAYLDALLQEIKNCRQLRDCLISTIFIGGGTPSVFSPSFIAQILKAVFQYKVDGRAEITLEANPGTITATACRDWKEAGINRLSIGLQAWQNQLLEALGRTHRQTDFLYGYETALNAGIDNINIDLIFSLPGQNLGDWRETLEQTAALNPAHLSTYGLIIEDDTVFGKMRKKGLLKETDEETDRKYYEDTKTILKQKGYIHYEISNFARAGRECLHNLAYWRRKNYIGLGLSAHSFFEGVRFQNTYDLDTYLKAGGNPDIIREGHEIIGRKDSQAEFMFLGLRTMEGISVKGFYSQFGVGLLSVYKVEIQTLMDQGLLSRNGDRFFLTNRGIDVSNFVFQAFL